MRHGFMDQYKSPDSERSMFKNIPMTLRHHPFVKGMLAVGCRVRYRGPRVTSGMHGGKYHTLKRDARWFSIYPPSRGREWKQGADGQWSSTTFWPWDRPRWDRVRELESSLETVRERMSAVREEMADFGRALQDFNREEQKILTELNRYNSVNASSYCRSFAKYCRSCNTFTDWKPAKAFSDHHDITKSYAQGEREFWTEYRDVLKCTKCGRSVAV